MNNTQIELVKVDTVSSVDTTSKYSSARVLYRVVTTTPTCLKEITIDKEDEKLVYERVLKPKKL